MGSIRLQFLGWVLIFHCVLNNTYLLLYRKYCLDDPSDQCDQTKLTKAFAAQILQRTLQPSVVTAGGM